MSETCSMCGDSVAPGSGKFANRLLDVGDQTRVDYGRPFPDGEYICYTCFSEEELNLPEAVESLLERLDTDPEDLPTSAPITARQIVMSIAEVLIEEEFELEAIEDEVLQELFDVAVAAIADIDFARIIKTSIRLAL